MPLKSIISFTSFSNVINASLRSNGGTTRAINPSSGEPLWEVPIADPADLDDAVTAAEEAFPLWSATTWQERQEKLLELNDALLQYKVEMSDLILREGGKPKSIAAMEVEHSARFLEYYANEPPLVEEVLQDDAELRLTQRYCPIGIVAAICPWNFPLVLAIAKISAAILMGNCVIVKPSPYTPYSILKLAEIAQTVLPPGVLQALNGNENLGPAMTTHSGIGKISFTGSTKTGKLIMEAASKTLKAVTLELGGNSATIICPDVDVAVVAPQVAVGSFLNSGQFCLASKRIYVHESIYQEFLASLVAVMKDWKAGPANEESSVLGPVQNKMQYDIVRDFFEDCTRCGHVFALDGGPSGGSGYIVQPAIVDNPPDDSKIVTQEPFGPIVPVLSWKTEEEVISRVNATSSGLGGAVWSSDIGKAEALARRVQAGTIWINSFEKPLPQAHLAGWKDSGVGGEWGRHGLLSYCRVQTVQLYKDKVKIS